MNSPLRNLVTLVLCGALTAALLGSGSMVVWVEDWPPGPLTDRALEMAHAWNDTTGRLGLNGIHPDLRAAERAFESLGGQPEAN